MHFIRTPLRRGFCFMPLNKTLLLGSLFVMTGELLFVGMGMIIKILSETFSSQQLVFFRNIFGALVLLPILYRNGLDGLKTSRIKLHLLRAGSGLLAMFCFFYAIANIQLANAMLLKMTVPLFIPIIAVLWIKEKVNAKTIFAIALGFFGVTIFLDPQSGIQMAGIIGLAGGALAGLAKVSIRKMSDTEPATRIVFYFALFGTLLSSLSLMIGNTHWPNTEQWPWLLLLGLLGTGGQLCLTQGYRIAAASQVATFTYSSLIWATIVGYVFWNELPNLQTVIGAALIILAGIVLIYKPQKG